jgi:D-beta-D-heptose 7-phosphate kinase/D-beta-D-heptose 1-phosphate adenosyltransferase
MKFIENISKAKILVVGDVMLDRYWWGSVSRISPEAPVPIVRLEKSSLAAGGAANVAVNIAGLGAMPVLVGMVGKDPEADRLREMLKASGVSPDNLFEFADRPTTVKTRVIAHSQQVARIDNEIDDDLNEELSNAISDAACRELAGVDAVVISDYAKGLITRELLSSMIERCRTAKRDVLVDPKGKDYSKYRGASLVTPNRREALEACNIDDAGPETVFRAGRQLMSDHNFGSVLITRGEEGMTLFQNGSEPVHFGALAREVYDVTGAGDTVIATLAASVACGAGLEGAAKLANIAAGVVVEQVGTTAITISDLRIALNGK